MLKIEKGVTAIIGSGGKTSLMYALAEELGQNGRVIVCTTTHILKPQTVPCLLDEACEKAPDFLRHGRIVCLASQEENKLTAPPVQMQTLQSWADYVLVEADGARMLPAKAHACHEPAVPPLAGQSVCVFGISAIGKPICKAAHRPQLFAENLGVSADTVLTPELAAAHLIRENLHTRIFINQADTQADRENAEKLAALLPCEVCIGSLKKGYYKCLY